MSWSLRCSYPARRGHALPRRMWDDLLYQIEPTIARSPLTIVLTVV